MSRALRVYRLDVTYPDKPDLSQWEPHQYAVDGAVEFRWPRLHPYVSRSGARHRAALLEKYGAKVTIIESEPVVWPEDRRRTLTPVEALRLVASRGCKRDFLGSCIDKGHLTPDARYGADKWCDPCIARAGLITLTGEVHYRAARSFREDGDTWWLVNVVDTPDGPIMEATTRFGESAVVCTGLREWSDTGRDVLEKTKRILDVPGEWKERTVRRCTVAGCDQPLPMWGGALRNCTLPDECLVCATRTVVACVECGAPDPSRCTRDRERLLAAQLCFTCDLWRRRLGDIESDSRAVVTVEWVLYGIGDGGNHPASCKGFGGAKFTVLFLDGRTVETDDLWYGGIVPERFRDRFTPNAHVVGSGASAPSGRKFVGDPTR